MAEDAEYLGLTEMARKLFGAPLIKDLHVRKIKVRDIWELTDPTTQCKHTIGPVVFGTTPCWICGLEIVKGVGLLPQCEHILPIAQATVYLKLYNTDLKEIAGRDKWLKSEYGWAHTVCNQEKSDTCPLIVNRARSTFEIDGRQIKQLLKDIYHSKRKDSALLKKALVAKYPTVEEFLRQRVAAMEEKYSTIIKVIASDPGGDPIRMKAANLITLAGITGLTDLSIIKPSLHELLNPGALAEANALIQELNTKKANWLYDEDVLVLSRNLFELYDEIHSVIVKLVSSGKINLSFITNQPKYREYFAHLGINPADPLKSINPDNFQSSIFDFIIHSYATVYKKLQEIRKGAGTEQDLRNDVVTVYSLFILYRLILDIEFTAEFPAPRGFKEKLAELKVSVEEKTGPLLEVLNGIYKTYELKEIREGAAALAGLAGANMAANAAREDAAHNAAAAARLASAERALNAARNEKNAAAALVASRQARRSTSGRSRSGKSRSDRSRSRSRSRSRTLKPRSHSRPRRP